MLRNGNLRLSSIATAAAGHLRRLLLNVTSDWCYSAAEFAARANSVEKAYGTRICAILDVSPQR